MKQEDKQLSYRESRAEAAMFHICRELYEIDVPNHPVKDGYRIGFDEGVEYAKKYFLKRFVNGWKKLTSQVNISMMAKTFLRTQSWLKISVKQWRNNYE